MGGARLVACVVVVVGALGCPYADTCLPPVCHPDENRACEEVYNACHQWVWCGECVDGALCDDDVTHLCEWTCGPDRCWWRHGEPAEHVRALFGFAADDIWAGYAQGARLAHWNGTRWDETALPVSSGLITTLWGAAPWDLWAAAQGDLFHWNGGLWSWRAHLPKNTTSLFGFAGDDVFGVGYEGQVAHWDGEAWSVVATTGPDQLTVVFGAGRVAWAAGLRGVLWAWRDGSWAPVPGVPAADFTAGWAAAEDDAWVAGDAGELLHWDGAAWRPDDAGVAGVINVVFGLGRDRVWLASDDHEVRRWDGAAWRPAEVNMPQGGAVRAMWGAATDDVWAAGDTQVGWLRWLPGWPAPERMTKPR